MIFRSFGLQSMYTLQRGYISNNYFQGISFTWSLLADETRLSVSSDLENIVISIYPGLQNVVILISGDLCYIVILKFYNL